MYAASVTGASGIFPRLVYAATRNFLSGAISRLSPYIRHGVVTSREVLQSVRDRCTGQPLDKFAQELAWRDYWRAGFTPSLAMDLAGSEPAKTGVNYDDELPANWGRTGLASSAVQSRGTSRPQRLDDEMDRSQFVLSLQGK